MSFLKTGARHTRPKIHSAKMQFCLLFCILGAFLLLTACGSQSQAEQSAIVTLSSVQIEATASQTPTTRVIATITPRSTGAAGQGTAAPTATLQATLPGTPAPTQTQQMLESPTHTSAPAFQSLSPTPTDQAYPGPLQNPEATSDLGAYPGPNPESSYPGPEEEASTTYPGDTGGIFGAVEQTNPTVAPTQIRATSTTGPSVTPGLRPSATPLPAGASDVFSPSLLPQTGSNPSILIWHALEYPELAALEDIIRAFQATFPHISIDLNYVPLDDLKKSFISAVYQQKGPDLLFGPSEWSAELYDQGLVADLREFFPNEFWGAVIPAALETGQHRQAQVSLPVSMSGVVLYRNTRIISEAAADFETLEAAARQATRGGVIGAYFELDPLYSMAHLIGLHGRWQDAGGKPVFNQRNYELALNWLEMIREFDRLGAVEVNTSRDVSLFRQSKVGLMIDGTWNLTSLSQSLGSQSLAVDVWPEYGSGSLSGYVFSQGFYLNIDTVGMPDARLFAALQFMGGALSTPSQKRLSEENSFLPVLRDLPLSDALKTQAVAALRGGTAFPAVFHGKPFEVYRLALQNAIRQALGLSQTVRVPDVTALQDAYQSISGWFAAQPQSP